MDTIQAGKIYRRLEDKFCFRVFSVMPDEDLAVVVRTECTSTRLRRVSLGALNSEYRCRRIIPVESFQEAPLPAEVRSTAAKAAFEKLRPALEELLAPGIYELSARKLWPDITRVAAKINVPPSTLNFAFSNVLMAGGVIEAAVPRWDRCGRLPSTTRTGECVRCTKQPGSYPLDLRDLRNIADGVRKFLCNGATWQEAHDKFLERYYPFKETLFAGKSIITPLPAGKRPSFFQFKWHGKRLVSLEERLKLQFGARVFLTNHRGCPIGQSAPAIYPGVVSEIDWTFTDIVGVARGSRLSIGRFVFYAIADVYSGGITAAYATMHSSTAASAGRAILQSLEDKVELCARYGLTITRGMWDMQSLMVELRSDRGEINSWKSTGLGTALGIKLEYCPSKRPDMKGTIESFFNVVRFFLRRLRGATDGHRERLKDHPNVTAVYDFDQVQKLLLTLAIAFNARMRRRQAMSPGMIADRVRPNPNEIYKWANERGCMREFPLADARIGALPTHFATVTAGGIKIKGLRYIVSDFEPNDDHGIEANSWLVQARTGCWKVEVGIDPSTVDYVWLRHRPRGHVPVVLQCFLSDEHVGYRGLSWIEYGLNKEEYKASIRAYEETHLREIRAWTRGVINSTTMEAVKSTASLREGMSASKQIAGTDDRRHLEMEQPERTIPDFVTIKGDDFFDDAQWGAS